MRAIRAGALLWASVACSVWAQSLSIDVGSTTGQPSPLRAGQNVPFTHEGEGIWDPTGNRVYPQVCQKTKALGPRFLRYPAGLQANHFTWSESIGSTRFEQPTDRCEALLDVAFGIDEFLTYVEHIRSASGNGTAVLILNVSPSHPCAGRWVPEGSPQSAVALASYVNGDPNDGRAIGKDSSGDWKTVGYWASQRASNGHPAPYGVSYFELGNELYDNPSQYASRAAATGIALKSFFPQVQVIATGSAGLWDSFNQQTYGAGKLGDAQSGGVFAVDAVALHPYGQYDLYDGIRLEWQGVSGRGATREVSFPAAGTYSLGLSSRTPLGGGGTISVDLFGDDSTNLETDPSFELGTAGWTGSGVTLSQTATVARSGTHSLQLDTPSASGGTAQLALSGIGPGSIDSIGLWIRGSSNYSGKAQVGWTSCSASGSFDAHSVTVVPSSTQWRRYAVRAAVPSDATCFKVQVSTLGQGTIFVDDVRVAPVLSSVNVPAGSSGWTPATVTFAVPAAGGRDLAFSASGGQLVFIQSNVSIAGGGSSWTQLIGRAPSDQTLALTAGDVSFSGTASWDGARSRLASGSARAGQLPFFLTEWNRDAFDGSTTLSLLSALWDAEYSRQSIERDDILGDNFFYLTGSTYGAFNAQTASPLGQIRSVRPSYHVLELVGMHTGPNRVRWSTSGAPTFSVDEVVTGDELSVANHPYVGFSVTRSAVGDRLYILAVSLQDSTPISYAIQLTGFTPGASATAYTVTSANVTDDNETGQPVALAQTSFVPSPSFSYAFAPHAVTVLEIPSANASVLPVDQTDPNDCGQGRGSVSKRPKGCGCAATGSEVGEWVFFFAGPGLGLLSRRLTLRARRGDKGAAVTGA